MRKPKEVNDIRPCYRKLQQISSQPGPRLAAAGASGVIARKIRASAREKQAGSRKRKIAFFRTDGLASSAIVTANLALA